METQCRPGVLQDGGLLDVGAQPAQHHLKNFVDLLHFQIQCLVGVLEPQVIGPPVPAYNIGRFARQAKEEVGEKLDSLKSICGGQISAPVDIIAGRFLFLLPVLGLATSMKVPGEALPNGHGEVAISLPGPLLDHHQEQAKAEGLARVVDNRVSRGLGRVSI